MAFYTEAPHEALHEALRKLCTKLCIQSSARRLCVRRFCVRRLYYGGSIKALCRASCRASAELRAELHAKLRAEPRAKPRAKLRAEPPYTELHEYLPNSTKFYQILQNSVLFCLVGVEKPSTGHFYPYRLWYFMHFLLDKGYFMLAYSHYPKPHWVHEQRKLSLAAGSHIHLHVDP